jgi:hypothetical protein
MANILNSEGSRVNQLSTNCPRCYSSTVLKGELSGADFDENGWFHTQDFTCQSPKCGHKWSERIIVAKDGQKIRYGDGMNLRHGYDPSL